MNGGIDSINFMTYWLILLILNVYRLGVPAYNMPTQMMICFMRNSNYLELKICAQTLGHIQYINGKVTALGKAIQL